MARKSLAVCLFFASCTLAAWGSGNGYTLTHNYTSKDYRFDTMCVNGGCWFGLPGSLVRIDSSPSGDAWGINASNQIFHWNQSNRTWTLFTGSATDISAVENNNVVVVGAGNGTTNTYYLSNGTSWVLFGNKLMKEIRLGIDGSLWALDSSGNIYNWDASTSAWVQISGFASDLSVLDARDVCVVTSSGTISCRLNGATSWSSLPNSPAATDVLMLNDSLFVLLSTGAIKYYDPVGKTWHAYSGSLSGIGGHGQTVVGVNSANHVFHLNAQLLYADSRLTGNYIATCGQGGCPQGSQHTAQVQIQFNNGRFGSMASQTGTPATNMNVYSFDVPSNNCDVIFGDENDPDCKISETPVATCTIMGALVLSDFPFPNVFPQTEVAKTRSKNTSGTPYNSHFNEWGDQVYDWYAAPYCSNTAFPDWDPLAVEYPVYGTPFGWDVEALCGRPIGTSKWWCVDSPFLPFVVWNVDPGRKACTYNP